jgi:hypothetical protein
MTGIAARIPQQVMERCGCDPVVERPPKGPEGSGPRLGGIKSFYSQSTFAREGMARGGWISVGA